MPRAISKESKEFNREELKALLINGRGPEAEEAIFSRYEQEAAGYYQDLINEVSQSETGKEIVCRLQKERDYRVVKRIEVTVTVKGGNQITVSSWYGLAKNKKRGPFKKGPNGTGTHVLLDYWGYLNRWSPGYLDEVVRCGVASASYDLAEEELKSRGIQISSNSVDYAVQKVGSEVQKYRGELPIEAGESLAGKRVVVSLDGGRIRTRQLKLGRWKKKQKQPRFDTPWREPKLLVITELDKKGKKKPGTKSIYEATIKGPEVLYELLVKLSETMELDRAAEIVYVGDGAKWVWNTFERLSQQLQITTKVTQIIDWCHAVEHLYSMASDHQGKSETEQAEWANQLKPHLKTGKLDLLTHLVNKEKDHIKDFNTHWNYFVIHKERMRYNEFEKARFPLGSGIVESAIKRVINGRIKSAGSFWWADKAENMLPLRCALLSGRWRISMENFRRLRSLKPN